MNVPHGHDTDAIPGRMLSPERPVHWKDSYECGHSLIDDQHRTLFEDANALLLSSQRGAPDVLSRFDELISHVLGHFSDEERVLRDIGFPGYAAHRRSHMQLADKAMRLREAMILGHHRHEELLEFLLQDVIERHLLVEDQAFFGALARSRQT
jgi:hemerythrin-like metal-binding protein